MDLDLSRHSDENQDIVKASEGSSGHATESEVAGHEKLAVITLGTSAYVKMARIMGFSQRDDQETTTNMLLEAIMEWNIANEHETSGPELILDHFGLKAEPFNLTLEKLNQQASATDFFPNLLESLLYEREVLPREVPERDIEPLSTIQL